MVRAFYYGLEFLYQFIYVAYNLARTINVIHWQLYFYEPDLLNVGIRCVYFKFINKLEVIVAYILYHLLKSVNGIYNRGTYYQYESTSI